MTEDGMVGVIISHLSPVAFLLLPCVRCNSLSSGSSRHASGIPFPEMMCPSPSSLIISSQLFLVCRTGLGQMGVTLPRKGSRIHSILFTKVKTNVLRRGWPAPFSSTDCWRFYYQLGSLIAADMTRCWENRGQGQHLTIRSKVGLVATGKQNGGQLEDLTHRHVWERLIEYGVLRSVIDK